MLFKLKHCKKFDVEYVRNLLEFPKQISEFSAKDKIEFFSNALSLLMADKDGAEKIKTLLDVTLPKKNEADEEFILAISKCISESIEEITLALMKQNDQMASVVSYRVCFQI